MIYMNISGVLRRNSIFTRLFTTFVLIMIPVYAFAISFYIRGESTLRNELLNTMHSKSVFFMNNLQIEVSNVKKLQYNLFDDDDLKLLAYYSEYMENIDRIFAIRKLQKRLDVVVENSVLINDASIYIPAINEVISASGGSRQVLNNITEEELRDLQQLSGNSVSPIIYHKTDLASIVADPTLTLNSSQTPSYIIETILSKEELVKGLKQMTGSSRNGCFLIDNDIQVVLASTGNKSMPTEVQSYLKQQFKSDGKAIGKIMINGKKFWIDCQTSSYLNATLVSYIAEEVIVNPMKKYQVWFWAFSVIALMLIVIYSVSTYKFIHKPLQKLVKAFHKVEKGELDTSIQSRYKNEFGYLYKSFNSMAENLHTLINQVYKQKILVQKSELKHLQSQINPHFLYNSFFILNSMVRIGEYENLGKFTEQLGEYFQFITRNAADEVPLYNEVQHARAYAEIQAMRFSDRIKVIFDELPDKYRQILIPRLIIQPIIENAYEHALEKNQNDEHPGQLFVSFKNEGDNLCIIVENSGDIMNDSEIDMLSSSLSNKGDESEITGIINIHRRLQLKFGPQSGLSFKHGRQGGLRVIITFPIA